MTRSWSPISIDLVRVGTWLGQKLTIESMDTFTLITEGCVCVHMLLNDSNTHDSTMMV